MQDRSSRPHYSPHTIPRALVRKIMHLRWKERLPVGIGAQLGIPASTVHAVLTRCRINRLSRIDVRTDGPVRRCGHEPPWLADHVDVKKLGNIPDGGAGAMSAASKVTITAP